jgi:SAM-dependent methyltransferase
VRRSAPTIVGLLPPGAKRLCDVGCSGGALLEHVAASRPELELSGVDIDARSIALARRRLPAAHLETGSASALPLPSDHFDAVTCLDTLEHVPAAERPAVLAEIHRILRPGGRLIIQVPHAGPSRMLDSQNLRHRFPRLYARLIGSGNRDAAYAQSRQEVVWHHHFRRQELRDLLGPVWEIRGAHHGGFVLAPLTEILRWPSYRRGTDDSRWHAFWQRVSAFDNSIDWGRLSYEILLYADKRPAVSAPADRPGTP